MITSFYHGMEYLPGYLNAIEKFRSVDEVEILFIHNDPQPEEVKLLNEFMDRTPINIKHIKVPLEGLYTSWNRAVREASGWYLTIWNVDDIRTQNSIREQASLLYSHPEISATYGDVVQVSKYGSREGITLNYPEFSRELFIRECLEGPFVMWKKSIYETIGFFDEQLIVAGDFDYWVRIAASFEMKKTKGIIGYYLHDSKGLSTKGDKMQPTERTVVELRYGTYDLLDYRFVRRAKRYKIHELLYHGKYFPISNSFPSYERRLRLCKKLRILGILRDIRRRHSRMQVNIKKIIKYFIRYN